MSSAVLNTLKDVSINPVSEWDISIKKLPLINPFKNVEQKVRFPVSISEQTVISASTTSPNFGTLNCQFKIPRNVASGMCDMSSMFLVFSFPAVTGLTSGSPRFIDGAYLKFIKKMSLYISGTEMVKNNYASIFQYLQRFHPTTRSAYTDDMLIGASSTVREAAVTSGSSNNQVLIPLPFGGKYSLRASLLSTDAAYLLFDFETLANLIDLNGASGTPACNISDVHLICNFIRFTDEVEKSILQDVNPFVTWYSDYQTDIIPASSTYRDTQLTFPETEFLFWYIESSYIAAGSTKVPFTPVTITKYYVKIDTENYPANTGISAKELRNDILRYFTFPITSGIQFISFSHVASPLETEGTSTETFKESGSYGSIIMRGKTVYLHNEFSSLAGDCTLHVFCFSRSRFLYTNGTMQKFIRGN
jgi:hypothetical protein